MRALVLLLVAGLLAPEAAGGDFRNHLPKVTVCDGSQFLSRKVDDGLSYSCQRDCSRSLDACSPADAAGMREIAFVTDEMAGRLHLSAAPAGAVLAYHPGGGGTTRRQPRLFKPLRDAGVQVVEIQWESGLSVGTGFAKRELGWFTRKHGAPSDLRSLSARPAAVLTFIRDRIAGKLKFGSAGCSGGGVATFDAVFYHGLEGVLDYQWFGGGPYFDIGWACGSGPATHRLNPTVLALAIPVDQLIDYVHKTGDACRTGRNLARFRESSPSSGALPFRFPYPVDFSLTDNFPFSDNFLGIRSQGESLFHAVQSPKTLTVEQGPHCATHFLSGSACRQICDALLKGRPCACPE